jgi:hypothetical protein
LLLQMLGGVRLFRRWQTDTTQLSAGPSPVILKRLRLFLQLVN